jgi:soluble lytic murein transglycosylase-like protein
MENHLMRFPQKFLPLHSVKFAPFAIISLFFLTNFTGGFFSPTLTLSVNASTQVDAIPADMPTSGDTDLDWIIFRIGSRQGVDPRFIHAVIKQESKYDPHALSPAGARGLMQLMPATGKRFGLKDANDAEANVEAGTKYLKWLLKRFAGDVSLTLAGYNAGEGAVDKYKGVPPFNETQNYVKKIVSNYGKTYHPVLSPKDAKVAFRLIQEAQASSVL